MKIILASKVPTKAVLVRLKPEEGREVVKFPDNRREIHLGVGPFKEIKERQRYLLPRRIVLLAKEKRLSSIAVDFRDFQFSHLKKMGSDDLAELFAVNAVMADFSFTQFKTKPKEGFPHVETIYLLHSEGSGVARGIKRGMIIGEEVNAARHISTLPGGDMTPEKLALHARKVVRRLPVRVKIYDERAINKMGLRGILAVGKGSQAKPRFIVMEYRGGSKNVRPIVLVGKGVTFDTGGINLKPSDSILGMNMDMSGGAAVVHTLAAAARLKLKKNIVALIPAVENMPSGESYRPGDIVRSYSGKTIEVQNTDAEGRIILADALGYAKTFKPALVVDVATLTGAAVVALGERASALFTEDEKLEAQFRHIGAAIGDFVWPLPLWDEYLEDIKGVYGDVANVGQSKWGGAITAALFLKQFALGYPWVHLDIAPRMNTLKSEYLEPSGAGAGIRLLIRFLETA